jgi:hypothetical protein
MTTISARKCFAGAAVAMALAGAAIGSSTPASAGGWYPAYGWGIAAGVATGMAAGAIASQAYRPAPAYYYGAPAYVADCYTVRRRVWTDYGWRMVRQRVCD